jgi:hypothetical protein
VPAHSSSSTKPVPPPSPSASVEAPVAAKGGPKGGSKSAPAVEDLPDSWDDIEPASLLSVVAAGAIAGGSSVSGSGGASTAIVAGTSSVTGAASAAGASSSGGSSGIGGRSLRPGGKQGFNLMHQQQSSDVIRYSKQEILGFKPTEKQVNPLTMYGSVGGGGGTQQGQGQGQGQWKQGGGGSQRMDSRNLVQMQQYAHYQQDGHENGGGGGGGGGGGPNGNGGGWKREPSTPHSAGKKTRGNNNNNQPAGPMPKKVISDPMQLLATEATAILNKITPQTFEKLSLAMLSLNITNIAELDKVIELIFEKAVQEQGFANLYAELCSYLNANAQQWAYYSVFRIVGSDDDGRYFWIKDCSFPSGYVGPFSSSYDCILCMRGPVLPELQPVSGLQFDNFEMIMVGDVELIAKVRCCCFAVPSFTSSSFFS